MQGEKNRYKQQLSQIPEKAKKVLFFILLCLLFVLLRVWHLSFVQYEKKHNESLNPRKKVVLELPPRGTIRDRFDTILACNMLSYRLEVVYGDMKGVPSVVFDKKSKKRRFLRREYIHKLSKHVAEVTGLDHEDIEDQIHSKGALFDSVPLVIKNNLTEEEYYRLKAKERFFPGLRLVKVPRRTYPQGKRGCHLLGYVGHMPKREYEEIVERIQTLSSYCKGLDLGLDLEPFEGKTSLEIREELFALKEKSYALYDSVGKAGVEKSFEKELRGYAGKKVYFCDAKGHYMRELPFHKESVSGKRLYLTLSIELQEFCEQLLAQSEGDRQRFIEQSGKKEKRVHWLRGGSIVALEPNSGEVVAMASFPRFDPNDFIEKNENLVYWIENDRYAQKVFDRAIPIRKEQFEREWKEDAQILTQDLFLHLLLPKESGIRSKLCGSARIKEVYRIQKAFDALLQRFPQYSPKEVVDLLFEEEEGGALLQDKEIEKIFLLLDEAFDGLQSTREKLLLIDLSRLILSHEKIEEELLSFFADTTIEEWRQFSAEYAQMQEKIEEELRSYFHKALFKEWRVENEKAFLLAKRKEEKQLKRSSKPYMEYIEQKEEELFREFYKEKSLAYLLEALEKKSSTFSEIASLLPSHLVPSFFNALKRYKDLDSKLVGSYWEVDQKDGKGLFKAFLRHIGESPQSSSAFQEARPPGSVFKLVTAYTGLLQGYEEERTKNLSLFRLEDRFFIDGKKRYVGVFDTGKAIPQLYKGGRIPKSSSRHIGSIDLVGALETSSNVYFAILAGDVLKSPKQLIDSAGDFGFGKRTNILLPGENKGNLSDEKELDKTGVYAMAIGQHTLLATPLQTARMLQALLKEGQLTRPKIARCMAGKELSLPLSSKRQERERSKYERLLQAIGVTKSVFSLSPREKKDEVQTFPLEIDNQLLLPREVFVPLFEGMKKAHEKVQNDWGLKLFFSHKPSFLKELNEEKGVIGKTSTAEVIEPSFLLPSKERPLINHISYSAIAFEGDKPELIVVVSLPYGGYGKHAAPLAVKVIQKWRLLNTRSDS